MKTPVLTATESAHTEMVGLCMGLHILQSTLLLAEMCSRIFLKSGMCLPYRKLNLYVLLSHLGVCRDTGKEWWTSSCNWCNCRAHIGHMMNSKQATQA